MFGLRAVCDQPTAQQSEAEWQKTASSTLVSPPVCPPGWGADASDQVWPFQCWIWLRWAWPLPKAPTAQQFERDGHATPSSQFGWYLWFSGSVAVTFDQREPFQCAA